MDVFDADADVDDSRFSFDFLLCPFDFFSDFKDSWDVEESKDFIFFFEDSFGFLAFINLGFLGKKMLKYNMNINTDQLYENLI